MSMSNVVRGAWCGWVSTDTIVSVTTFPQTVFSQLANAVGMTVVGLIFPACGWMGKSLGNVKRECFRK